jgi:cytoskeletal protein CcmA (bactofilin family)
MKYSGLMTMPGGSYRRVKLEGMITIEGDMECDNIRTEGLFTGNGTVKSTTGKFNGSANVKGSVVSDEVDVNGELKVGGDLSVQDIDVEGRLHVKGSFASENIDMRGELKAGGNCDAEVFNCKGTFKIDGTLNAGEINASLYAAAHAKEIGGEKISIRKGDNKAIGILSSLFTPIIFGKTHLTVETIEGDEIHIEHTTARVVRGDKVSIGDGCEIDLVEYRTDLKKTSGARIKKQVKV